MTPPQSSPASLRPCAETPREHAPASGAARRRGAASRHRAGDGLSGLRSRRERRRPRPLVPGGAPRAHRGARSRSSLARNDAEVDLALARNPHLNVSGTTLEALVERARERPALATALLDRAISPRRAPGGALSSCARAGVGKFAQARAARGARGRVPTASAPDCAELVRLAAAGAGLEFGDAARRDAAPRPRAALAL